MISAHAEYRAPDAKPSSKEARRHRVGGNTSREALFPFLFPLDGPHAEPSIGDRVQRLT